MIKRSAYNNKKHIWLQGLAGLCLLAWALILCACDAGSGGPASSGGTSSIVLRLHRDSASAGRIMAKGYITRLELSFYDGTGKVRGAHLFDRSVTGLTEDQESVVIDEVPAPQDYYFGVRAYFSDSDSDSVYSEVWFWASVVPGETAQAVPIEPEPTPTPTPSPEPTEVGVSCQFALAESADNESDVPFTAVSFAIAGYHDDTKLYPADQEAYTVSKDAVSYAGQVQQVTLENVPLAVNRFEVRYLASDGALIAQSQADDLTLSAEGPNEILFGGEGCPIMWAALTVTFSDSVEYPSTADSYSVQLIDSTGTVTAVSEARTLSELSSCAFEHVALNTAEVSANWQKGDRIIARTIVSGDALPKLEAGQSYMVTISDGLIGTTNVKVSFASALKLPSSAETYYIAALDQSGQEIIKSEALDVPLHEYVLTGVPVDADSVLVQYFDARQKKLAISSAEMPDDMSVDEDASVTIDAITKLVDLHLTLKNCFTLKTPLSGPVGVTVTNAGSEYTLNVDYSKSGEYELTIPASDYDVISVSSVVLSDGAVPFEWLDYSKPVTENDAVLDVAENEFANGKYVSGQVMEVANPRQLDNVRAHMVEGTVEPEGVTADLILGDYKQIKNIDFAGSCGSTIVEYSTVEGKTSYAYDVAHADDNARFAGDSDKQNYGWEPIGSWQPDKSRMSYFCGTYDGGGYSIRGMVIDRYASSIEWDENKNHTYVPAGLFGDVSQAGLDGDASQAGLKNIVIGDDCQVLSKERCAGLCGHCYGVAISNCSSAATVIGVTSVGGMLGSGWGNVDIRNCENTGNIIVLRDDLLYKWCLAGGICGNAKHEGCPKLTITNCTNSAKVEVKRSSGSSKAVFLGGIIGRPDPSGQAEIERCINTGDVTADINDAVEEDLSLGGIVGGDQKRGSGKMQELKNCTNKGIISADISASVSSLNIGGIVGKCYTDYTLDCCINECDVTCEKTVTDTNMSYVGGVLGWVNNNSTLVFANLTKSTGTLTYSGPSDGVVGGIIGCWDEANATKVKTAMYDKVGIPSGVEPADSVGLYCGSPKVDDLTP